MGLVERVNEYCDAIEAFREHYDCPPTAPQLAEWMEVSGMAVRYNLRLMERMGMIDRENKYKLIYIVTREPNWNALVEPLPGEVLE